MNDRAQDKVRNWLTLATYAIVGSAVTYGFLLFLTAGMTQHRLTETLEKMEVDFELAEAYDLSARRDSIKSTVVKASDAARTASAEARKLEIKLEGARKARDESRSALQAAVTAAKVTLWCPERFPAIGEPLGTSVVKERIDQCLTDGVSSDELPQYAAIMSGFGANISARKHQEAAETMLTNAESKSESEAKALEEFEKLKARADQAHAVFLGTASLDSFYGFDTMVRLPSSILAIFLSFSSGLFGALLIHLILICYPDNTYSISRTAQIWQYVLLGGLIAVAVYVALGAGSSVLGFSGSKIGNPTNFFAYSAIGLFSGMFSDRAADWLSTRATFVAAKVPQAKPEKKPPNVPATGETA